MQQLGLQNTRSDGSILDLAIIQRHDQAIVNEKINAEDASQALARIDEDTEVFGLKSDRYRNGQAIPITIDESSLEILDNKGYLDRFLLQRVQITTDLLRSVLRHQSLTYLALTDGALFGDTLVTQFCTGLQNNETLKTANLLSNHFSQNQLEAIIKTINTTKVIKFLVAGNNCNASSMQLLADSLPFNSHLQELSLSPRHVDATYADNIREIIEKNQSLTSLKLYPMRAGAEPPYLLTRADLSNILQAVKTNTSLQGLLILHPLVERDAKEEFGVEWSRQISLIFEANTRRANSMAEK